MHEERFNALSWLQKESFDSGKGHTLSRRIKKRIANKAPVANQVTSASNRARHRPQHNSDVRQEYNQEQCNSLHADEVALPISTERLEIVTSVVNDIQAEVIKQFNLYYASHFTKSLKQEENKR
ncbi:MAG: hypothetical protein HQK53_10900 [Oligoflexia bacterium]|nr:hypothetical protein [Oligoflexia bacterium]